MGDAAEEQKLEIDVGDAQETEVELPAVEEAPADEAPEVEVASDGGDDKELENHSEAVQKRINRLTKKMREAERQREEALRYAQSVQSESEQIRQRMQSLDQGFMAEYGNRIQLQQEQAENELRRAVELGDPEGTVAAQKKLTELAVANSNYQQAQRRVPQQQPQQQQPQPQNYQSGVQQPQYQQAQAPDPKAEQWAEKNEWFGQDEAMTFAAFGIHKRLIEDEGFDPKSDDYYNELDNRIKREFPHKFENSGSSRRPAQQTVAGVSRTTQSASGRSTKRVKLSPTQVAIAKKLGVPLEEYAKYVKE
jgi:hypothetical protein